MTAPLVARDWMRYTSRRNGGGHRLLYVDDEVVVANKPSGLLVHRGWDDDDDVAVDRVRAALGAMVHPLHRLDRGTSGALLFARSATTAAALGAQFADGSVDKRYIALVRGEPPADTRVDHPVPKAEEGARVPAVTQLGRVRRSPLERCSLVEAMPQTGRLHQIRRHLKHLSCPIVGDVNYGNGATNRHYRERYGLRRLALHAAALAFAHPATGARLEVRAPLPDDLTAALAALGLADAATAMVSA